MTRADLWQAANIMRRDDGTNGINEYIEQISWMFFLKVYDDLEKRFEDEHLLKNKKYNRIIPKKFSWSSWTTNESKVIISFIDDELFPFLGSLSGSPEKNTIGLIFTEIRKNKMKSAANLKDVVDIINKIDFNNEKDSHVLSQFYEELLVKLGKESGIAGEFYTPRPIVRLVIKIVDPKLTKSKNNYTTMVDPFCGSCGFLIESYKSIKNKGISPKDHEKLQKSVFHGYEKKTLPYLVGLMNCIVHNLTTPNIIRRNSLNDNILKFGPDDKFDYVLTNPPFGGQENKQIQQNFPVKIQSTELLALQQVMRRLKPDGECGMVVPEGLFSRGEKFAKVKKELVENYNIHTIISLPSGVFANVTSSGVGPITNLIFFDKTGSTKKIWYYELIPPNGKNYSKANPIKDKDLEDCFKKFKKRTISTNSWIVNVEDIIKKNFDLTAKNPNKIDKIGNRTPKQIISKLVKDDEKIRTLLNSIKKEIES